MALKVGQWSLRGLLIAAAVLPIAIYALLRATPMIASMVLPLASLGWIAMVIVWLTEKGERQAFARGATIVALAYGCSVWYITPTELNHPAARPTRSLITSYLLDIVYASCETTTPAPASPTGGAKAIVMPKGLAFMQVGHAYWCVMVGTAGGFFARWVYQNRERQESSSSAITQQDDGAPISS
jgi:hypothetical protein